MALELIHGTQICSWAPPLPQRAFQITDFGVTHDNMYFGGYNSDGKRYNYVVINTTNWAILEGFHDAPLIPGEQFQLWTAGPGFSSFPQPPAFGSGSAVTLTGKKNGVWPFSPELYNVSASEIPGSPGPTYTSDVAALDTAYVSAYAAMLAVIKMPVIIGAPKWAALGVKAAIASIKKTSLAMQAGQDAGNSAKASTTWQAAATALALCQTACQAAAATCTADGHASQAATLTTAVSAMATAAADSRTCASTAVNGKGNRDGVSNAYVPLYTIKDATLQTVAAVQQKANNSWYVFFSPGTNLLVSDAIIDASKDGLVTVPRPYKPKWLGQIGHVSALNYTYALPGGPDQLTCKLLVPPDYRTDATNPGRILTAHRGSACIWEGILTEPQATSTGWTLTANGVGTYGANFGAWWQSQAGGPTTKTSSGWTADAPIDFSIARGLRWQNRGIGKPAGIYLGPVQDPGSLNVTDFLNLLCTGGALTWELIQSVGAVSMPPAPWELHVYPIQTDVSGNPLASGPVQKVVSPAGLPLTHGKWKRVDVLLPSPRIKPDLYLINTNPVSRTINATYNTIVVYYEATADVTASTGVKASAATFSTTFATIPSSVAIHGRMEYFLDVSNAGAMTGYAAAQIAQNVLNKYIRANFAGSFTVQPGQLVNIGGVPVDLGCNHNGSMVTVQVINAASGGEVGNAPLTFMIGEYEYDDDTQTATITPYQNARADIASVIAQLYPGKFA